MMASARRVSTDRGHRVENGKRGAHVVGVLPARDVPRAPGRASGGRSPARRSGIPRPLSKALPPPPPLKLADLTTETGKGIQEGFRFIFMGAVRGIRNRDAHELFRPLDDEDAIEQLSLASMLMRRLDGLAAGVD